MAAESIETQQIRRLVACSKRFAAAQAPPPRGPIRTLIRHTRPARVAIAEIAAALKASSRACREDGGPGPLRQSLAMWKLAFSRRLPPPYYYEYRLYRPEISPFAGQFLEFRVLSKVENAILEARRADRESLTDKRRFEAVCGQHDVATVPTLAWLEDGRVVDAAPFPPRDLFSKPGNWVNGRGTVIWRRGPDGRWSDGGPPLDREGFLSELARRSVERPQMLQPLVTNHPGIAALGNGGACTARVITIKFPGQPAEHLVSVFKMTAGGGAADNFVRGGLLSPVEPSTGTLGPALRQVCGHELQSRHPDSGATIPGSLLPGWHDALATCLRFHDAAFDRFPGIGWDIALTGEGPVVIEGNWNWSPTLPQLVHRPPLGSTRLAACYLAHLDAIGIG